MEQGERKLIYILLIVIVIASLLLIIKINTKPEYDTELYARVYEEYRSVMKKEEENNKNQENNITNNEEESNGGVYLIENLNTNASFGSEGENSFIANNRCFSIFCIN